LPHSLIESWQEIYFKGGLHAALAERAKSRGQARITQDIAQLYARLAEYKADKQFVNRKELTTDLKNAQQVLQGLV
jgi:hypothetical protein